MIEYIVGKFKGIKNGHLILEKEKIGYSIFVPEASFVVKEDEEIKVFTHLIHKEDTMALYGFASELEKEVFVNLLGVSGVGPKSALAILSKENVENIISSIAGGDEKTLSSVSGVGQKTSKKIILDLKEKFKILAGDHNLENASRKDTKQEKRIVEALVSLGYKKSEAKEIINSLGIEEALSDEEYLKLVLKEISKSK